PLLLSHLPGAVVPGDGARLHRLSHIARAVVRAARGVPVHARVFGMGPEQRQPHMHQHDGSRVRRRSL
ncbi:hypothetical protein BN1723_020407, partial [Verticillium longisporum]